MSDEIPETPSPRIVVTDEQGVETVLYEPTPMQLRFHMATAPNVLMLGSRGSGKSLALRFDAYLRCLSVPNFHALVLRRTMPELRRSHLVFVPWEVKQLGGEFLSTVSLAKFPNGSTITFAHCETEADILNFLSAQYGLVVFDELSTYTLDMFLQISSSARAPVSAPYIAMVRAGSNPLGIGSDWMYGWFQDKDVKLDDFPDYRAEDFEVIPIMLEDNPHLDRKAYAARLSNLPKHVRRAWLLGLRVVEGQYFSDFTPNKEQEDEEEIVGEKVEWHVISDLPTVNGKPILSFPGLNIFRCIDWGFFPDPAVCIWVAVLPDKTSIAFMERSWTRTLASGVAQEIKRLSQGMHVVETFSDPSMFIKSGETGYSIGDIFETNGVPLTSSVNRRDLLGYAIHHYLNNVIDDHPQLVILKGMGAYGCKELIRTLPQIRMDKSDPTKMAEGEDHWVVALGYFCSGGAQASHTLVKTGVPFWMKPKRKYGLYSRR